MEEWAAPNENCMLSIINFGLFLLGGKLPLSLPVQSYEMNDTTTQMVVEGGTVVLASSVFYFGLPLAYNFLEVVLFFMQHPVSFQFSLLPTHTMLGAKLAYRGRCRGPGDTGERRKRKLLF